MTLVESVNLLYVGKNGGCQIVIKVEYDGDYVKAYNENGEFFVTSVSNFYKRVRRYEPKYVNLNKEEIRHLVNSLGIPVVKEGKSYKIPEVTYEGFRDGNFTGVVTGWEVKPFFNDGLILFELVRGRTKFIITANRLKECYRGIWEDYIKNIKPISKEELEKILKEFD